MSTAMPCDMSRRMATRCLCRCSLISVALPDQTAAEFFASLVAASGYKATVVFDKEDAGWDCYCTKPGPLVRWRHCRAERS